MKKKLSVLLGFVICAGMLTSCGLSNEAKNAMEMIDNLPDSYSEGIDDDIQSARNAYEALSDEEKEEISTEKFDLLDESKKQYILENTKTFEMTPKEFAANYDSGSAYTVTDNNDGTSDFEFTDTLLGISYCGKMLTDNEKIISIKGEYSDPSHDSSFNTNMAMMLMPEGLEIITGMSDGMDFLFNQVNNQEHNVQYGEYIIDIGMNDSGNIQMDISMAE